MQHFDEGQYHSPGGYVYATHRAPIREAAL
jgi:hypothetical protein